MVAFFSMTSTLKGWCGDTTPRFNCRQAPQISASNLANDTAMFYFGCAPAHLAGVPYEATWNNIVLPRLYDPQDMDSVENFTVSPDKVDEELRGRVRSFLSLVHKADGEGRVHWNVQSYPTALEKLVREADAIGLVFDLVWLWDVRWSSLTQVRKEMSCDPSMTYILPR